MDRSPSEIAAKRYRWAPILQIAESTLWDRRRVTRTEVEKLATTDQRDLAGSMPSMAGVLRGSGRSRVRWGAELGRRFRARLRSRIRQGDVAAWQFDEILTEVAGRDGRRYRDYPRDLTVSTRTAGGSVETSSAALPTTLPAADGRRTPASPP